MGDKLPITEDDIMLAAVAGGVALIAARRHDWQLAVEAIAKIPRGRLPWVMLLWADVLIAKRRMKPPPPDVPMTIALTITGDDPQRWQSIDDPATDPDVAWAGRFIAARLTKDTATIAHLILDDDIDTFLGRVSALLATVAESLNAAQAASN